MFRDDVNRRKSGFTLIELLVVIAIIALLIAILLPSLNAAKREGQRTSGLANLRSIGQASIAYATDDAKNLFIPVHPAAQFWQEDGYLEYGGNAGICPAFAATTNPQTDWGAPTRPLNRMLYGPGVGPGTDFKLFQDPADTGFADSSGFDPALILGNFPDWLNKPVWLLTGASYGANCFRSGGNTQSFFGPFMRPQSRIPSTSETIGYIQAPGLSAAANTIQFGQNPPESVMGWNGKLGKFNTAFCDGSGATISMLHTDFKPPVTGPLQNLMLRGPNWRWDCLPDARILEP